VTAFQSLDLHTQLLKAVDALGFKDVTEVQEISIPQAIAGRDIIVSAKTGSGKTAAFILPMLNRFLNDDKPNSATRGLILLPTRELALQTQKFFEKLARYTTIKSGLIIGGEAYKHQVASLRRNPEVIIATPGRLVDHVEKGNTDFKGLEVLVLDEADRMLDMGFAEAMHTIISACSSERQNLLYSATLHHKGFARITRYLTDPLRVDIEGHEHGHVNIVQQIVLADDDRHKENLVAALIEEEHAQRICVFCKTRAQSQKVSNILISKKLRSHYIHGEVSQNDRKQIMNRFRDGGLQVLVATDLAARGLDIENIDLVINYSLAHTGDDHVHRVGRTGRAGKQGKAITLVGPTEWNQMSSIERYLKIRFAQRKVKGMVANFTGPKKLKSSGKAAGSKKKKVEKGKAKAVKKPTAARPASPKAKPSKADGPQVKPDGPQTVSRPKAAAPNRLMRDGYEVVRKKKQTD
jgi:ATP-dependent RNA helicase SrmB